MIGSIVVLITYGKDNNRYSVQKDNSIKFPNWAVTVRKSDVPYEYNGVLVNSDEVVVSYFDSRNNEFLGSVTFSYNHPDGLFINGILVKDVSNFNSVKRAIRNGIGTQEFSKYHLPEKSYYLAANGDNIHITLMDYNMVYAYLRPCVALKKSHSSLNDIQAFIDINLSTHSMSVKNIYGHRINYPGKLNALEHQPSVNGVRDLMKSLGYTETVSLVQEFTFE